MNVKKEIAKFLCGFEAFHALFHGYLWLSGTTLTVFSVTATPSMNLSAFGLNGLIMIVLGAYAWWKR